MFIRSESGLAKPAFSAPGENVSVVNKIQLLQNYPNPFNPTTTIEYSIPEKSHIKLIIYNSLGEIVQTLADENLNAGSYIVNFDGSNYSSGVYYYRLISGKNNITKKFILLR